MPKKIKSEEKPKTAKEGKVPAEIYFEAVGRRKTAVARVRIFRGVKKLEVTVNGQKNLAEYFPLKKHQNIAVAPFKAIADQNFKVSVKVSGGGVSSQAEAVRLGIARALIVVDIGKRPILKSHGFLTRDSRKVERKKPGLRKARRPQQWRKR